MIQIYVKAIALFLFFVTVCAGTYAQSNQAIVMKYDENGNRISRKVVTLSQTRALPDDLQEEETFKKRIWTYSHFIR